MCPAVPSIDQVTIADFASQALVGHILQAFPHIPMVGEEVQCLSELFLRRPVAISEAPRRLQFEDASALRADPKLATKA